MNLQTLNFPVDAPRGGQPTRPPFATIVSRQAEPSPTRHVKRTIHPLKSLAMTTTRTPNSLKAFPIHECNKSP